jgi:hypothetical protein
MIVFYSLDDISVLTSNTPEAPMEIGMCVNLKRKICNGFQ